MKESKPNCLLVDDLEENLLALKGLLQDENLNVYTATSGEKALELMLKHDFAVALLDVQMPEMDGFELAEIMRSTDRTRSIPIIFVTAAGGSLERTFKGYEAGAVDFLHKPLHPYIVVSKIRIFVELYKQKSLLQEKVQELHQTRLNLEEALKSRDEFISICSHELKTPLTSLKMQVQLVQRSLQKLGEEMTYTPERMNRFLETSDRSVDRIIHLVNDMLDISRVQTGRLTLKREPTDLSQLISEVCERMRPILELAGCKLTVEVCDDLELDLDRFRIEQVLTNLLSNTTKYAPDAPVVVRVRNENNFAFVDVIDQGDGIPPEHQQRIFQRFERAGPDNSSVTGLGLGLYISREIMTMHGGSLSVESTQGQGSTFTFALPRVP